MTLSLCAALLFAQSAIRNPAATATKLGKNAFIHTQAVTMFGPRPPGSPAHEQTRKYIEAALMSWKLKPEVDSFTASTPVGKIAMHNIVAKIPGKTERVVILSGHYDTKRMPEIRFVGANDGGSSTGLLLELTRMVATGPKRDLTVWVAFLDGEEAVGGEWTTSDSLHGSKHMAQQLKASGKEALVQAVINVDMIGDKNLGLWRETNSSGWLTDMVREVAAGLGLMKVFGPEIKNVEDDHLPFLAIGIPAVDLIDLSYDPWHTEKDTLDKISPASLDAVGRIVLGTLDAIAKRPPR